MRFLLRARPSLNPSQNAEYPLLIRMAAMYFLIMCSLGILKPIKNAFALVGLANTQFYRVYLISALVLLFVPLYSRLAERVPLRALIPGIALFFALNLLLFRAFYLDGSLAFGLLFYGWYDLFAAVLVTQFFLATQMVFDARVARRAYPLVIAGGSLGATLGGAITGFFAERLQTPNLLLVAAGFLVLFILALPLRWQVAGAAGQAVRQQEALSASELRALLANPHLRLIALTVLIGLLVKQLVDYQFNTISWEVFQTRDAISTFQGKFNAATQWLPLLSLLALQPLLKRWGIGSVLFLLPVALLGANLGLALSWSLAAAVVGKAADIGLRHTAERTGREILYLPVPENLKMKAKVYIDMAVEEGLGKALSAGLIFLLLLMMDYRRIGFAAALLSVLWLLTAIAVQREYVRTLAKSIQGRFASLRGLFTSLADASTLPVVRQALASCDPLQAAFALDLLDEADPATVRPVCEELHQLLDHPSSDLRERSLATLARVPTAIDFARLREKVSDPARRVREAAIHALCAARPAEADSILRELLGSPEAEVRTAALACLVPGEVGEVTQDVAQLIGTSYIEGRSEASRQGDVEARVEIALAAGTLGSDPRVVEILDPLLGDPHPRVAAAALQSAGLLGRREFYPRIISALRTPQTREAAREALRLQGPRVVGALADRLLDQRADPVVRRYIPAVLAGMPAQATVDVLLRSLEAPETDELLDYRILKALNKLRARHPELEFDRAAVLSLVGGELDAAASYTSARAALGRSTNEKAGAALLATALREAWSERRERVFRWLGLLYPPDAMYRCYLAVLGGETVARANALEWLEETVGYTLFHRLAPVLQEHRAAQGPPPRLERALRDLWNGGEPWLAGYAIWTAEELGIPGAAEGIERLCASPNPELRHLAESLLAGPRTHRREEDARPDGEMNLIEKVFLLQQVDLLQGARSAHLALLASIAEEIEVEPGTVLIRQGEPTDALYVVIRGAVELRGAGEQLLVARDGTPFGTWALIDESPSLFSARAVEDTRLLRITRSDFYDLLADHHELALGLLQGLARRVRTLVS
ncbi:hypothetical protein BH24GEM3_BH24GEM3_12880 [soil metagenome]